MAFEANRWRCCGRCFSQSSVLHSGQFFRNLSGKDLFANMKRTKPLHTGGAQASPFEQCIAVSRPTLPNSQAWVMYSQLRVCTRRQHVTGRGGSAIVEQLATAA